MGLLDEAIREHLELRRRRGADPGLVAREEHDALGPVSANEDPHVPLTDQSATDADGDFSHIGQETAELDMRSVLEEPDVEREPAPPVAAERPDGLIDAYDSSLSSLDTDDPSLEDPFHDSL
jgi:hypothetical protein